MNINEIITEAEYSKERSAKELFEWMTLKNKELSEWSWEQPSKIKHKELSKDNLPKKFAHELTPFAYYAKTYYGNNPAGRFKPCCGSEQYDGIIINSSNKTYVEFTNAIYGNEWSITKEVLIEKGRCPYEYNTLSVTKKNRAEKKKLAIDIVEGKAFAEPIDCIYNLKELVKRTCKSKCQISLEASLPYGQNKTILIITFDDTVVSPRIHRDKRWDDFVNFKHSEIDSMKHKFIKIFLFGWLDKAFID